MAEETIISADGGIYETTEGGRVTTRVGEVGDVPVGEKPRSGLFSRPPVNLSKQQLDNYYELMGDVEITDDEGLVVGKGPDAALAAQLMREFANDRPDLFPGGYIGFKKAQTSENFNEHPLHKALSAAPEYAGKPLTDVDIINLFARDSEGNKFEEGTILGGMKREILPSVFSLSGAVAGAKSASAAVAGVPPVTLPTLALRFGAPIAGGIAGGLIGYNLGEGTTDLMLGAEQPVSPGTRIQNEMGKTAASGLGWLATPYLLSTKINLGGAEYLLNMSRNRQLNPLMSNQPIIVSQKTGVAQLGRQRGQGTFGSEFKLRKEGDFLYPEFVGKRAEKLKDPMLARFARFAENMLSETGKAARRSPISVGFGEVGATAGATAGTGVAEKQYPNQALPRLAYEFVFSVPGGAAGIFGEKATDFAYAAKSAMDEAGGIKGIFKAFQSAQRNEGVSRIIAILEEAGYSDANIDEIARKLADPDIGKDLVDEKTGKPIAMTAGLKTQDPAMMIIEAAIAQNSTNLTGQRGQASKQAKQMLENQINALILAAAGGDKRLNEKALQEVARITYGIYQSGMMARLERSTDEILKAYERVKTQKDPETGETIKLDQYELGQKLFDSVDRQLGFARAQEKKLWSEVPDIDIDVFYNKNGEEIAVPNFITTWDSVLPRRQAFAAEIEAIFPGFTRFVNEEKVKFGITGQGASARSTPVARAFNKITGTNYEQSYTKLLDEIKDLPAEEQIKKLREVASRSRGRFSNKRSKDYANLLDAKAESITVGPAPQESRFDQISGEVDPEALKSFNDGVARMEAANAQEGRAVLPEQDYNNPDNLRRIADMNDQMVAQERNLYNQDPVEGDRLGLPANITRLQDEARLLRARAEDIENPIAEATETVTSAKPSITLQELQEARQRLLDKGQDLMANNRPGDARIAYAVADAILDDIASIEGYANGAYQAARSYSRALNDTFTRSFAGNVLGTQKTGAQRIAPEVLADRYLGGGVSAIKMRTDQLLELPKFLQREGAEDLTRAELPPNVEGPLIAEDELKTITGTLNNIIRNASRKVYRETILPDGSKVKRVDPAKLSKWIEDHEPILGEDGFATLKRDLMDSEKAETLFRHVDKNNKRFEKRLDEQRMFQNLLPNTVESPIHAIDNAFANKGKNVYSRLNRLVKLTDNKNLSAEEQALAKEGLLSSILEWSKTGSGMTSGTLDARTMYTNLFGPMPGGHGKNSLMDYLEFKGLIDEGRKDRTKKLLTDMVRIETASINGNLADLAKEMGPMVDFYVSIAGSAAGTRAYNALVGGSGPGAITAASRGQQFFADIFNKVPESIKMDVMGELMRNPTLLGQLMRKPKTAREKAGLLASIRDQFVELGFIRPVRRQAGAVIRETDEEVEQQTFTPPAPEPEVIEESSVRPSVQPRIPAQPAAPPPTTALASVSPPPAPRPAPPAPQTGPVNRASYAAMFPNDIASSMIRQQGIGSLMG